MSMNSGWRNARTKRNSNDADVTVGRFPVLSADVTVAFGCGVTAGRVLVKYCGWLANQELEKQFSRSRHARSFILISLARFTYHGGTYRSSHRNKMVIRWTSR